MGVGQEQQDKQQFQTQVERILSAENVRIPARRARLLRYLAERSLHGVATEINEYSIALDVFERPASFDPKTDAVVRAEISRLRQNLAEYYSDEGAQDPVVVTLPPRSYVLAFSPRNAPAKPARTPRYRWAAALIIPLLAAGVYLLRPQALSSPDFSLAVLPVSIAPAAGGIDTLTPDLGKAYYGPLARIPGLHLMEGRQTIAFTGPDAVARARRNLWTEMLLETAIDRQSGALQVRVRLLQRSDGTVIWTQTVPLPDPANPDSTLIDIAWDRLRPVLEARSNRAWFQYLNGAVTMPNPCAQTRVLPSAFYPRATLDLFQETTDARSSDTRIPLTIEKQAAYAGSTISIPARVPAPMQAPPLMQLAEDTCVLMSVESTMPVYGNACLIPSAGANGLRVHYQCTRSAWPIDISTLVNSQQIWSLDRVPYGARILDGIPFLFPENKKPVWMADTAAGGGAAPVTLSIPVNRRSVSRAYFLLNSQWGQPGPASYLAIEFAGDRGARFVKPLVGGVDIRDYHRGIYVNSINGTTSRVAYEISGVEYIDMVTVDLPAEFHDQTLQTITLRDTGRHNFQRAILRAVTVQ